MISFSLAQSVKEEVRFNLDDVVPSAEDDDAVFTADSKLMFFCDDVDCKDLVGAKAVEKCNSSDDMITEKMIGSSTHIDCIALVISRDGTIIISVPLLTLRSTNQCTVYLSTIPMIWR